MWEHPHIWLVLSIGLDYGNERNKWKEISIRTLLTPPVSFVVNEVPPFRFTGEKMLVGKSMLASETGQDQPHKEPYHKSHRATAPLTLVDSIGTPQSRHHHLTSRPQL